MSRRRISCKDLGLADCQGWLYKKKEKASFIGNKWKKFWCVLKGSSLYWYSNQLAEKAEGFLCLSNFTVDQALECKKKYAIKIIHPQIKTFYFAAENAEEMNIWLNKLGMAVVKQVNKKSEEGENPYVERAPVTFLTERGCEPESTEHCHVMQSTEAVKNIQPSFIEEKECYSESDHEEPEINMETPPPPYSDQPVQPHSDPQESSSASHVSRILSSPESSRKSQGPSSSLSKVLDTERQSWLDFVNSSSDGAVDNLPSGVTVDHQDTDCLVMTDCNKAMESGIVTPEYSLQNSLNQDTPVLNRGKDNAADLGKITVNIQSKEQVKCSIDEMEKLYKSLEQASLSPLGDRRPSTKRELRKSFIKRSKNPSVNEKLHKIRALNSTLKCKERDLAMINQLLEDSELTARKYREWKNTNSMLVQDIYQQQDVLNASEENIKEPAVMVQPSFIESTI